MHFVKPIDLITVLINTLVKLENAICTLSQADARDLPGILPRNRRSIVTLTRQAWARRGNSALRLR